MIRAHPAFSPFFFCLLSLRAAQVVVPGLQQSVEVLRDRWGVPHIYARNTHDLFFAQGYIAALDRLWQIDMWRRMGTGKLAEVLGPSALRRDRLARAVQFAATGTPNGKVMVRKPRRSQPHSLRGSTPTSSSLSGKRPLEFRLAGYYPACGFPKIA